ncbi:MAG: hypothetical protein ABIP44_09975 [Pseudoxanthomonas sp.]
MSNLKPTSARWIVASCILVAGISHYVPSAAGQGLSAKATVVPASSQSEVRVLRQQVLELARRIKVLEEKIDVADTGGDAAQRKLEQRLAQLEHHQAQETPAPRAPSRAEANDRPTGQTVVAPFTDVDGAGKPILRVSADEGAFSRGAYVFNDHGATVAHMGATTYGGRFYVIKPGTQAPDAWMGSSRTGSEFRVGKGLVTQARMDEQSLAYYGDGGAVIALFGGKERRKGYLELNDASGSKMVEAGSLDSHKGYVLANPYRASVDPHGDPSVLKGAGK